MSTIDRIIAMRELADRAARSLAAIEREIIQSDVQVGPETIAIASQCAATRLMLLRVSTHFGEVTINTPAVRYKMEKA
jgi:hypothetical protein